MAESTENRDEMKGLTRFHKLTITCGIAFSFFVAFRFFQLWRAGGGTRAAATGAGFVLGGIGLALYLKRFFAKGI